MSREVGGQAHALLQPRGAAPSSRTQLRNSPPDEVVNLLTELKALSPALPRDRPIVPTPERPSSGPKAAKIESAETTKTTEPSRRKSPKRQTMRNTEQPMVLKALPKAAPPTDCKE